MNEFAWDAPPVELAWPDDWSALADSPVVAVGVDAPWRPLRLVEGLHNDELSRFSQALTRHWQNLAYGHRLPPENLKRGICEAWRRLFAQERRA